MSNYLFPAYVYKITINHTGQFYFGFRKANKAEPENDFLVKYFSCSSIIRNTIKCQGVESIKGEIIFKSFDPDEAYWYEQKVIADHFDDPLNINFQYVKPNKGFGRFITTADGVRKMLETRKRNGSQKTSEWIEKQRRGHNKRYLVTSPQGEMIEIVGLKAHCEQHNLNHPAMSQVGQGKKPHHKGWKCQRL